MSDSADDRSPGFNSAVKPKLIIATLFVIAGTASVAYYIKYHRGRSETVAENSVASAVDSNIPDESTSDKVLPDLSIDSTLKKPESDSNSFAGKSNKF